MIMAKMVQTVSATARLDGRENPSVEDKNFKGKHSVNVAAVVTIHSTPLLASWAVNGKNNHKLNTEAKT